MAHLSQRVGKRAWLGKLENITVGHGVSLLQWRSGGENTPTITPRYPFMARWQPVGELARPPRGWLRAIREALGMTGAQLAARLKVSQPRIVEMENAEQRG